MFALLFLVASLPVNNSLDLNASKLEHLAGAGECHRSCRSETRATE